MADQRAQYIEAPTMEPFPSPEADIFIKRNSANDGWENTTLAAILGQEQESIVPTDNQTDFVLSQTPIEDGYVMMFVNGQKQQYGDDYTNTGANVAYTGDFPIASDDTIEFWYITSVGTTTDVGSDNYSVVQDDGSSLPGETAINFVPGSNVTLSITDEPGQNRTNVEIAATGGASSPTVEASITSSTTISDSVSQTSRLFPVDTSAGGANGPVTVTFPANGIDGELITLKDVGREAGASNITITPNTSIDSQVIDGLNESDIISNNRDAKTYIYDATNFQWILW